MTIQVEFKGDKIFVTRKVKLLFDKFVVKTQVSNTNTVAFAIQENYRITKEVITAHRECSPVEAKSFEEAMEQAEFHAALDTVKAAERKGIVYEKVDQSATRQETGPDLARPITDEQKLLIDYIKQVDWKQYSAQTKPKPGETKAEFVQRHFATLAPHFERIYDDASDDAASDRYRQHLEETRGVKTPPSVPSTPKIPSSPLVGSVVSSISAELDDQFGFELAESTLFTSSPLPVRAVSPTKVSDSDKAKKLLASQAQRDSQVKFDNLILPKQPDWLKYHE